MQTNKMKTLAEFIIEHGLSMTVEHSPSNPNMVSDTPMNHWLCRIKSKLEAMEPVHFSTGMGIKGKPTLPMVLECLAMDASTIENARSFEEWCSDLGFDSDSRKAERSYRQTFSNAKDLKDFLGDDDYKTLLWDTGHE